jgi:Fe-S-cluster containining protein
MKFNCWECGACCKLAGIAVENAKYLVSIGITDPRVIETANFPYEYETSGRCSKLDQNNKCTVYEDRPSICKVSETYNKYHIDKMTEEEYYKKAEETCKILEKVFDEDV